MTWLLDTEVLLWWLSDDSRLSDTGRNIIANPDHEIRVSVVSFWEMENKISAGRLVCDTRALAEGLKPAGLKILPLLPGHLQGYSLVPALHSDPFDRMLIAQSRSLSATLLTSQKELAAYGGFIKVV